MCGVSETETTYREQSSIHTTGSIVHTLYYGAAFDTFPETGFTVVNKLNMKLFVNVCFGFI